MKIFIPCFVAVFTLISCGSSGSTIDITSDENEITQFFWALETLGEQDVENTTYYGKTIGFKLDAGLKKITGYTGCNNFFGTYSLTNPDLIQFSSVGTTKMACPDLEISEGEFLDIFNATDNYRIEGGKLNLYQGRVLLATFKKTLKLTNPIVEKYWKLKTLDGKEVVMDENQEREVYFILKANDNRVVGFGGCNSISGEYEFKTGNKIAFDKVITTLMACPDHTFREDLFLKVFERADHYELDGDILKLKKGKNKTLATFESVYF